MSLSYTNIALTLLLAWIVSYVYRFYRLYRLLPPGPTCFAIFHFYDHPLGVLLPPLGDYCNRFVLTIGPQHWSRAIMLACVGPRRVNKTHDYLNTVSLFPLCADTMFYDAEAMRQLHADRSRFERPRSAREIVAVYGENVLTTSGKEHKRHRAIAQPSFSDRTHRLVLSATESAVQQIFEQHDRDFPESDVLFTKVHSQMGHFALQIISEAGFGEPMSWEQVSDQKLIESTMGLQSSLTLMTAGQNLLLKMVLPRILFWLPIKKLKLVDSAFNGFQQAMKERISQRLSEQEKGEEKADLFDALVLSMKQPNGFTDSELLGNIFTFLLAGHETTANIISATLAMLALYPDEQEKVYERRSSFTEQTCVDSRSDVKEVTSDGLDLSFDHLPKLDRLLACVYEALRMLPPTPSLGKVVEHVTTLPVTRLDDPAGTADQVICHPKIQVSANYLALHYNPRFFPEPNVFKPDRFLASDASDLPFYGFSKHTYSCIGRRFAEVEMLTLLARFILRYRFKQVALPNELPDATRARYLQTYDGLTLRPEMFDLRFIRR